RPTTADAGKCPAPTRSPNRPPTVKQAQPSKSFSLESPFGLRLLRHDTKLYGSWCRWFCWGAVSRSKHQGANSTRNICKYLFLLRILYVAYTPEAYSMLLRVTVLNLRVAAELDG